MLGRHQERGNHPEDDGERQQVAEKACGSVMAPALAISNSSERLMNG
jgi:hypothetical protein